MKKNVIGSSSTPQRIFQWLTQEQSNNLPADKAERVKDEIGDILNCTLLICNKLNIDPLEALRDKLGKNELKYPVEKSKGNAKKYTGL